MGRIRGIIAAMSVAPFALGCGGSVNYNPATTSDITKPGVNVLVSRPGAPDVEVQALSGPSAKKSTNYGTPAPNAKSDFSVLATATDNESGIRHLKLNVSRTVCFKNSNGSISPAGFPTVVRKEATYTDQQHAPTQASLGETGIIDNTPLGTSSGHLDETNLLVWKNSQGTLDAGVGVSTKWGMEATNFAGQTTYSDVIYVLSGDVSCVTP